MNKAILMSIQPKWLVEILNGKKTIEIRKTIPKCKLPIDVYLYCTKKKPYITQQSKYQFTIRDTKDYTNLVNGKVVAKFTLNKVEDCCDMGKAELEYKSRLSISEICSYIKAKEVDSKMVYAWHIDNLVIFDKSKELSEFMFTNVKEEWTYYFNACEGLTPLPKETFIDLINRGRAPVYCYKTLSKAPQSWQYAYVKEK